METLKDKTIDAFYCSPYQRSVDTIRQTAEYYKMTIQTDIRLRERESGINGNTHELVYLYYPICEVVALLHCGRQKAVNALRELQYAGLVEIQKQGCGKPNRIYPKSYEAVPNTDFKKSGCSTPEG